MATMNININADSNSINGLTLVEESSTSCTTFYLFSVNNVIGNTLNINLTGNYINNGCDDLNYIINTNFVSTKTNIKFYFEVQNGGSSGVFNSVTVDLNNVTLGYTFDETVTRFNDNIIC
jgi:hypothetical protein